MHTLLEALRRWIDWLRETDIPAAPAMTLSPRELADLPVFHPRADDGPA